MQNTAVLALPSVGKIEQLGKAGQGAGSHLATENIDNSLHTAVNWFLWSFVFFSSFVMMDEQEVSDFCSWHGTYKTVLHEFN